MVNLSEKQYIPTFNKPSQHQDTLLIDNGTYEIRAGYPESPCVVTKNQIYKNRDRVSLEPFPAASLKTMFDSDVVMNFDVLEYTIDSILEFIEPKKLSNLIFTDTPYSPTKPELLKFLFEVYKFDKIQIGYDFIYAYHKYFNMENCLIVALKNSSVVVAVIENRKIDDIYKLSFGAKSLHEYIGYVMTDKYKNFRVDYRNLADYIRVSEDYNKESLEIYSEMCDGIYNRNIFLTEHNLELFSAPEVKKVKKNSNSLPFVPEINLELLNTPDEHLDLNGIKEKRKQKLLFSGAMHRIKTRIERMFLDFNEIIDNTNDQLEKQHNMAKYIEKKKNKFYDCKRELELRDKLRKDSKNKKTREFLVKNKETFLDNEELKLKNQIIDAEDETIEQCLYAKMDALANELVKLDPDFIPYYANTVEILRGDNIGRQCVNIELIKWAEIFFEPSIIGSEEMGLSEIFENVSLKYDISNVLVYGGLSYMKGLTERIEKELNCLSKTGNVNIIESDDSCLDAFYGMKFSELLPVFTRKEFEDFSNDEIIREKTNF